MARILLLSNGHGEDLSGALLGRELINYGHEIDALPFVGFGSAYVDRGIRIIASTREFSTGGLGYTSFKGRLTELVQGQLIYLLTRLFRLFLVAGKYDLLVVIGDVVPILAAWLARRPVATYLVAYSSHYEGKLRLPWPCRICLSSKHSLGIYARDQYTSDDLTGQLRRPVYFLGNPFMDQVLISKPLLNHSPYRLGLLPGSRRPELDKNILLLLNVVESLKIERLTRGKLSLDIALVSSLDDDSLANLVSPQGWRLIKYSLDDEIKLSKLVRNQYQINIHRNSFVQVLQSSDVLLSMAGTATEQAIGLAKPVVQIPGCGPQFTQEFAEAQRRLLGPTIFCAENRSEKKDLVCNTAEMVFYLLERIKYDLVLQRECKKQANMRLGEIGGGRRLARRITDLVEDMNC